MPSYRASIDDFKFLMVHVIDCYSNYENIEHFSDVNTDFMESILAQAAHFTEQEIQPLNLSGHEQGCRLEDGQVITPDGYREVFQKYIEGGWIQISENPEFGGQGLPLILNGAISEMNLSACTAFSFYITRDGSVSAIENNASEALHLPLWLIKMPHNTRQVRALTGPKHPEQKADTIIVIQMYAKYY